MFLPGFACPPSAYRSFLAPVALRVGRVVVPPVGSLGAQVTGRSSAGEEAGRIVALVDLLRASGIEVWLGGHSRGALVAWHAAPMARPAGVVLVDPVSGGGPPWQAPEPPPPIEVEAPVTIIGFAVGGRCAPEGRNHEVFAEAMPAAHRLVVHGCGHADILDGAIGRVGSLACGHGPDPASAADRARHAVLDALQACGAFG